MPLVSIIIVAFNSQKYIGLCLQSIIKHCVDFDYEIIVVDNNSSDKIVELIKTKFSQVKLIENQENFGFSRANNQGARKARGKYIFFINPDVALTESIYQMIKYFDKKAGFGAVAPLAISSDEKFFWGGREHPTVWYEFCEEIGLARKFKKSRLYNRYHLNYKQKHLIKKAPSVSGGNLLIKRTVFNLIGGWDREFFLYGEDVDLCLRLEKHHREVWFYPAIKVIHYGGKSSRTVPAELIFLEAHKSMYYFFDKHFGRQRAELYRLVMLIVWAAKILWRLILFSKVKKARRLNAINLFSFRCFIRRSCAMKRGFNV
ncbi:MAG: family 2 glycosyl transferase [Candidatus Berkelbacteria bacterium Licking1014_7]|uniref:Family 2 glycosyl transferase n=1 Tax=Candidatus Berkelbacteria bacterium Licking1014_7 TaxID=2017147 RepID=A0A554LJK9_9BACT|nr:MAG: family 2 glycosyl transferase [Candidatus Berkelbacteria bacterium Licking1014_7]